MVTLQAPFTMTIAGSTSCGKTYFVKQLIEKRKQLIDAHLTNIYYNYAEWQSIFSDMELQDDVKFAEGLPNINELEPNSLLILDDLFMQLANNKELVDLFCVKSHHKNISVIFITQSFYYDSKVMRCVTRNSHYLTLFKSPRMAAVADQLSRQLWPQRPNYLLDAYNKATKDKLFSYLFLNLHPSAEEKLAVLSNIIPKEGDYPHVFI
jgi:hypothetical protein